jgi:hypothetical protein
MARISSPSTTRHSNRPRHEPKGTLKRNEPPRASRRVGLFVFDNLPSRAGLMRRGSGAPVLIGTGLRPRMKVCRSDFGRAWKRDAQAAVARISQAWTSLQRGIRVSNQAASSFLHSLLNGTVVFGVRAGQPATPKTTEMTAVLTTGGCCSQLGSGADPCSGMTLAATAICIESLPRCSLCQARSEPLRNLAHSFALRKEFANREPSRY